MAEYQLLNNIIDYMEKTGLTYKLVSLSIDDELVEEINKNTKNKYSMDDIKKAADKCLAHEWLTRSYIGSGNYTQLQITHKGIAVARSKRKSEELKLSRSFLKKFSDYIVDHKGLFMLFPILVVCVSAYFKYIGVING